MTASAPNAELAYRVLDHIDANPQQWDQGRWIGQAECGTVACFASSLLFCLWIVSANGLAPAWIALAVLISVSNTVFELFSPRGTDDFTMTVANALICWAFGAWLY